MRARTGVRRGYSIVEVVVAMALSSLLLVVVGAWIVSMVGTAKQGSDSAAFHTDTMAARTRFAADVRTAGACDATSPAVVEVTAGGVRLWRSALGTAGGGRVLVSWRISGDLLQRAEQTVAAGCAAPALPADPAAWSTVAANITVPTDGGFYASDDGTRVLVSAGAAPADRIVGAVGLDVVAQTDVTGVSVPVVAAGVMNNYGVALAR